MGQNYSIYIYDETQATNTIDISYTITTLNDDNTFNAKIIVKDGVNGILSIQNPEGMVIQCNGEKEKEIEYKVSINTNYTFKITNGKNEQVEKVITIDKIQATSFDMETDKYISVGGSAKIKVEAFEPSFITVQDLTFESSDEKIVTVSEDGNITGIAEGEATIIVTASESLKKECKIHVQNILYLYNNGDICTNVTTG